MLSIFILFLFLVLMLVLSFLYSGCETAVISLNRIRLKSMSEAGLSKASLLWSLVEKPHPLINSLLLGNNFVNFGAAAFLTVLLEKTLHFSGAELELYTTLILTPVVLIFCEVIPKSIFRAGSNTLSLKFARFIDFSFRLFWPLSASLDWLIKLFSSPSPNQGSESHRNVVSKEHLQLLLKMGVENGVMDRVEHRILYGIMGFSKKEAGEVMTPRVDVKCVEMSWSLARVAKLALDTGFSRFPVHEKDCDQIRGVIYVMDIINAVSRKEELMVSDLIRKTYFVPESKKVPEIMAELKKKKMHMAVVIDEYGGMAGILTMDDILEEIFGELLDEFDREDPDFLKIDQQKMLVNARVSIEDINNSLYLDIPDSDEYETLGGFLFFRFGYIPRKGERVTLENAAVFEVFEADENSVSKVIVEKIERESEA